MFSKIELGPLWLTCTTPVHINIIVNLFLYQLIHWRVDGKIHMELNCYAISWSSENSLRNKLNELNKPKDSSYISSIYNTCFACIAVCQFPEPDRKPFGEVVIKLEASYPIHCFPWTVYHLSSGYSIYHFSLHFVTWCITQTHICWLVWFPVNSDCFLN
jgi:hypothetical protein